MSSLARQTTYMSNNTSIYSTAAEYRLVDIQSGHNTGMQ